MTNVLNDSTLVTSEQLSSTTYRITAGRHEKDGEGHNVNKEDDGDDEGGERRGPVHPEPGRLIRMIRAVHLTAT